MSGETLVVFGDGRRSGVVTLTHDGALVIEHQDERGRRGPALRIEVADGTGLRECDLPAVYRLLQAATHAGLTNLEWSVEPRAR
jgi:hypothetical protein